MDWDQLNERLRQIEEGNVSTFDELAARIDRQAQRISDLERQIDQTKSDAEYYTDRAVRAVEGQVDDLRRETRYR